MPSDENPGREGARLTGASLPPTQDACPVLGTKATSPLGREAVSPHGAPGR